MYKSLIILDVQAAEACLPVPGPRPPPRPHAFQCDSRYGTWDASPWTYEVPVGDFCSTRSHLPGRPVCARNEWREAPRIRIADGEGTECMINMFNSPGKQQSLTNLNTNLLYL